MSDSNPPVDTDGDAKVEEDEKKSASPVSIAIKVVLTVVVLFLGFKFGIGPLISAARGKKTVVRVYNATDTHYTLRFGWRMLSGEVYPNSSTQFELDVGMPETQKLSGTVAPPVDGAEVSEANSMPFKGLRVPVAPGSVTLVNVNQAATFYEYRPELIAESSLASVEALQKEIVGKELPRSAYEVIKEMRVLGEKGFVVKRNDAHLNLREFKPQGALGYYATKDGEPVETPVLSTEPYEVKVANGSVKYSPDTPVIEGSVAIAAAEVTLPGDYVVSIPANAGQARLVFNDKEQLSLRFSVGRQTATVEGRSYNGTWNYNGGYDPKKKAWSWSWTFTGQSEVKANVRHDITLPINQDGVQAHTVRDVDVPKR